MSESNDLRTWRAIVHRKMPILSPVLFAASYVEDETAGIGTFCIRPDTLMIRYNPKFALSNTPEQNAFILAHEAAHYLCDHMTRRDNMQRREGKDAFDLQLWMLAEDSAVNELIVSISGWDVPEGGVPIIDAFKGLTTEERYEKLKQGLSDAMKKHKKYCTGNCIDPQSKPGGEDSSGQMLKAQIQDSTQKETERMMKEGKLTAGNMPGELRELAMRYAPLRRPPDWKQLLMRYLIAADFNCKYFDPATLYKRRLAVDNLCLPNLSSSPSAKRFVCSMDNSGSVSDEMFRCLKGIIHSAATQLGFQEIIVQHFTSEVRVTERLTDMRQVKEIKRKADGGTSIVDCDEKAKGHKGQFHIILTDGFVDHWLERYSIPTIVVRTVKSSEPPFKAPNLIGDLIADADEQFDRD